MCDDCMPSHMRSVGYCGCRFRRFLSPQEEIERLEGYRDQLQREIAGVEHRINELKRK
jgi:hypothetical protein